jgi:Peptidase family M28/PDZ domain
MELRKILSAVALGGAILSAGPLGGERGHAADAGAVIDAADAGRHVAALADDAFEGREGGSRGGRAAGAYIVEALRAAGIQPAGDDGTYFQRFGAMRNILALVPGSDPACERELVVVGAHYDHVGYGTAANSYGPTGLIHNGADDNASGVAGVLEIAQVLGSMPVKPRRPILVAFWDGEEKGLLGSWHFMRVRPQLLRDQRPVFAVNLDMIGRLRGDRVEVYGARTMTGLRRILVEANRETGLDLVIDWDIVDDSDHFPFIESRVPTVMLHTGLHDEYHRPSDDVQLVDTAGVERVARLALEVVTTVADAPGALPPFRDASRREKNAHRDALERVLPLSPGSPRGRWGMSTRADAGDPQAPTVVRVVPDSPLDRAGLRCGDRILAIDGEPVGNQETMLRRMAAAGDALALEADRAGRRILLQVVGGGAPSAAAEPGPAR